MTEILLLAYFHPSVQGEAAKKQINLLEAELRERDALIAVRVAVIAVLERRPRCGPMRLLRRGSCSGHATA